MDDKDKIKFAELMTGIGEMFNKEFSKVLTSMYFETLKAFDITEVEKGFYKAISVCKFFPKPAEIIECIGKKSVSVEDKSLVIANEIISHLQANGAGKFPEIANTDPITNHLMTTRWRYHIWAATVLESELKWWTKEFCEAYRAYENTDIKKIEAPSKEILKLIENIGGQNE